MSQALEKKKEAYAKKLAKLQEEARKIKISEKKSHTKKLVEIGKLAEKAGLGQLDELTLLGSFLEIANEMKKDESVTRFRKRSLQYKQEQSDQGLDLITVKFEGDPIASDWRELIRLNFNHDASRNEWIGTGSIHGVKELMKDSKATVRKIN